MKYWEERMRRQLSVVSSQLSVVRQLEDANVARTSFENLAVYRLAEDIADMIWSIVGRWSPLARDTVGKQLIRAADSIGANVAEGVGRRSFQDNRRFTRIARGSLNETKHWLRRAFKRGLLDAQQTSQLKPLIDELAPRLNAYLKSIGRTETTDH
jgi:four helix bundle protein